MNFLRSRTFRSKLKSAFLIVIILSVLITGGFSYSISARIVEKNALNLTQDTVTKSAQIVDEKLNKLMIIMMTFMLSQPFRSMLKDASTGEADRYYTHLANMDNVFSQARIAEPLIHSIYISTPIGEFYPLTINRNRHTRLQDTFLYERVRLENKNVWVEGHEDMLFSGKDRVISLILEPIFDAPVKDVYIVVNIREEGFRNLVEAGVGQDAVRFLLNAEGVPVYSKNNDLVQKAVNTGPLLNELQHHAAATGSASYRIDHRDYLLNYARLGIADWTMVTMQSKDDVLRDLIYVKWMIVGITLGAFLITALISGGLTRYLLSPLQGLQKVMKRVEANDLTARFNGEGNDELAQVGFRFNRMLEQVVVLIDEVKQAETNKRTAEIKALSAQMDPHFLYNTLNTVYWKLKLGQVEESQRMVVSLSRLFQLGLNKGNEITTLQKELEHVKQYLEIQKLCYPNLFHYEIRGEISPIDAWPIPRLMLQPLVENSILHGFKDMETGGQITIEIGYDPEQDLGEMKVTDNGRGMEEHLPENGYAIRNLMSRLQLFYGDRAKLTLDSKPGRGTTVTVTIPRGGVQHVEG
ncbi:sensor histidine kinase [Paenibacillus sp. DXFW5]|uniref:Sensor histidine kinase n=1 Tax=Paenibacillus rhizolycopersici TaxID=2780073 RepID=A0ABS2H374_9BACL|nr:sensor histidine kinase [Paenibacillus rhizolycopersici]MBM6995917.1 sensor histidine kinase [Paenibacillus rhizolycopersici]